MQIDEESLKTAVKLLRKPRTVDELGDLLSVSRRTVYRWLDLLVERGYKVRRVNIKRPTKYQIVRSERNAS